MILSPVMDICTLLFYLCLVAVCEGFSRGAPRHACKRLLPLHGADPQDTPSPYTLQAHAQQYEANQVAVNVTLSWDGSAAYKGYLLQARDISDELFGEFFDYPDDSGFLVCNRNQPQSSITHSDGQLKTNTTFLWRWPRELDNNNEFHGPVIFKATVVQEQLIFWTGHEITLDTIYPTTPVMESVTTTTETEELTSTTYAQPESSGVDGVLVSVLLLVCCLMV